MEKEGQNRTGQSRAGQGRLTCMTLILEADSPLLILTVRGMGIPSAIPATSLPSLVGLRSSAAPKPCLVASEHTLNTKFA